MIMLTVVGCSSLSSCPSLATSWIIEQYWSQLVDLHLSVDSLLVSSLATFKHRLFVGAQAVAVFWPNLSVLLSCQVLQRWLERTMEIELLHYVNKVTLFVVVEWTIGLQQQWGGLFMPERTQYIALIQLAPFHSMYVCVCVNWKLLSGGRKGEHISTIPFSGSIVYNAVQIYIAPNVACESEVLLRSEQWYVP